MNHDLPQINDHLGKYKIQKVLGSGAMGAVYLAHDAVLGRKIAIKVVRPNYAGDPDFHARFLREARTLAQLNHPNVVQIYDVSDGQQDHLPFLVTEFVDGQDLQIILGKEKSLPWRRALNLTRQIALGLKSAAAKQIVHRDVKPGNILVTPDDVAKVTDFGLAKPLIGDNNITQNQVVMGTPDYIAPEQAMGQEVDWRADQYALGCTLFHLLAGTPPFVHGSPAEICAAHVYQDFPSIQEHLSDLPTSVADILNKMVQKRAAHRYASYSDLVNAIDALLQPKAKGQNKEVAVLVLDSGPMAGMRFPVDKHPLIIGRLPECDLTLDDPRASRKHAVVQYVGDILELKDLGSRNGVILDGTILRHGRLKSGCKIQIGDSHLHLEIEIQSIDDQDEDDMLAENVAITAEYPRINTDNWFDADDEDEDDSPIFIESPSFLSRVLSTDVARLLENSRAGEAETQGPLRAQIAEIVILHFNLLGIQHLVDQLSPSETVRRINDSLAIILAEVFPLQGSITFSSGEALQVAFGAPLPVPGSTSKAAHAALRAMGKVIQAQRDLGDLQKIGVCAGLCRGQALLGVFGPSARQDYGSIGPSTNLARALATRAPIGGLLCDAQSAQDLDRDFTSKIRMDLSFRHGRTAVHVNQIFVSKQQQNNFLSRS